MKFERIVTGMLVAIAIFWIGASFLVRGGGVPDWWLPVAMGAGLGATQAMMPPPERPRTPRWATWTAVALIALAFTATAYGATATASRHWDGAASFDAKVFWLVREPTLQQPFFGGAGVFHHGPDYPLLQSLLTAMTDRLIPGGGRMMLPLLYLLLCGVVAVALRRRNVTPALRAGTTLAVALTPALLSPGGGAVDSGYHELLLLLATTTIAAGLLDRSPLWFALGTGLAVASKPEGTFYAAAALAVSFAAGHGRMLRDGFLGFAIALATWTPVRAVLLHHQPTGTIWLLLAIAAIVVGLLFGLTGRLHNPVLARCALVGGTPIVGLLTLPWLAPLVPAESAVGVYLRQADAVIAGLGNLPAYLGAFTDYAFAKLKLGLAFALPIAAMVVARMRGTRLHDHQLMAFLLFGLLTTTLPFVLSPEPDLDHHLRSSLPRLLLHWIGPAWLLTGAWIDTLRSPRSATSCSPLRTA